MRLKTGLARGAGRFGTVLLLLLALLPGGAAGCRHLPAAPPEGFTPEDYQPVTLEQLRDPRRAGLFKGQRVSVTGYFWQYLDYDPCAVARYLAVARHPLAQSRLRWAALYDSPQMQGYFDRLVLTPEQRRDWDLKRLEHVRVYGIVANLEFGFLYLQAHHLDRLGVAEGPSLPKTAASQAPGQETPNP
jgi:hypothetical protein